MDNALEAIKSNKLVVIYRGMRSEDCLEASQALMSAGIRLFEITMNSPDTPRTIDVLRRELGSEASIGAGTVTTPRQVETVADQGASYIVSPNTSADVIRRTKQLGLTSIPGAFSPTEVMAAWAAGADMVKVFPINVVGPEYITQLKGPIDGVPFMATGGIRLEMVRGLVQAGTDAVGIGVHLMGKQLVDSKDWEGLCGKAEEFVAAAEVQVRG